MRKLGKNRRHWRNALTIGQDFTQRQIIRIFACAAIYVFMSTLLMCVFYMYFLDPRTQGAPPVHTVLQSIVMRWEELPMLRMAILLWVMGMAGMSALFATATGLYLSKNLAGPIYRLKLELNRIVAGEPIRRITLRKSDELSEVADALNAALEVLQRREAPAQAELAAAETDENLREANEAMRRHLERLAGLGLCETDAHTIDAWIEGMRDLLDKGDGAGAKPLPPRD